MTIDYRTPAGRQNPSTNDRSTCHRCGGPLPGFDPTLQGADPEQPPSYTDPDRIVRQCHSCSLSSLMKPGY